MSRKIFYAGDIRGNYRTSRAMKSLMENSKVKKVLNNPEERQMFYKELRERGESGVTNNEMREILGKLRNSGGDSLDRGEIKVLADELIKSGRKYAPYSKHQKEDLARQEKDPADVKNSENIIGRGAVDGSVKPKSKSVTSKLRF
jgi:hypothetical protein